MIIMYIAATYAVASPAVGNRVTCPLDFVFTKFGKESAESITSGKLYHNELLNRSLVHALAHLAQNFGGAPECK
jgi:hypothetical protein